MNPECWHTVSGILRHGHIIEQKPTHALVRFDDGEERFVLDEFLLTREQAIEECRRWADHWMGRAKALESQATETTTERRAA